jgi:hypothetical protein
VLSENLAPESRFIGVEATTAFPDRLLSDYLPLPSLVGFKKQRDVFVKHGVDLLLIVELK